MSAITWRNIDAPDLRAVAQIQEQGAQMIQKGLGDIGNIFDTMAENQSAYREKEMNQALGEFNLELSQMTPEQIQEFMQSPAYSADALKSRFGENVDLTNLVGDVRNARDSSIDNVIKMSNYANVQDAQADKPHLSTMMGQLMSGDMVGAQETAKLLKSPEAAQNAFNIFRKTMESDRSYGLDIQRLGLDAASTQSTIALNNANIESINLRNQTAQQELALKTGLSEFGNFLATEGASTQTGSNNTSTDAETALAEIPKGKKEKPTFKGLLDYALNKLNGTNEPAKAEFKVDTPQFSTQQAFQIAALTNNRHAVRGTLEAFNAQRIREKKVPIPITEESIDMMIQQGQQSASPTSQQLGRISSNIDSYNKRLQQTVDTSKKAAYNFYTENNPVYGLYAADRAYSDIKTPEDAIKKANEYYKNVLGEDNTIEGVSIPRYLAEFADAAAKVTDERGLGTEITPAQQYYLMTTLLPNTGKFTYTDSTVTNKNYAYNLVKELSNIQRTNGIQRFREIDNKLYEAERLIDETAANQSANAAALIQTNTIRNKPYDAMLPSPASLDNFSENGKNINLWVTSGIQNKTAINKWKAAQAEKVKPKPAFTGNAQRFEPRKQEEKGVTIQYGYGTGKEFYVSPYSR